MSIEERRHIANLENQVAFFRGRYFSTCESYDRLIRDHNVLKEQYEQLDTTFHHVVDALMGKMEFKKRPRRAKS